MITATDTTSVAVIMCHKSNVTDSLVSIERSEVEMQRFDWSKPAEEVAADV